MAPLVIPEKLLQVDNKSNREKIKDLIRKRILENTRKGNLPRAGLPKPFLLGDNIVKIANATAFSTGKRELTLPTVTDKKKEREALLRAMTDETGAARKSVYGKTARKLFKNQEDHHIIFRTLLDKFYKDLPEDEAAELTSAIARRGTASGNVLENLVGVDKDLHQYAKDSIHDWARDVQIEVRKGFPDLNNLDLDGRIDAVTEWLDLIEEPVLDKTAETLAKQDLRRYGSFDAAPAKNKEQWLELFTNQRQNIKARANLLDKYPILAEDLDSPDIRPELKARYDAIPIEDINEWENLTDFQKQQELAWINDPDIRKTLGKPTGEVTEVGRRLGGIGDTISTKANLFKDYTSNIIKKSGAVIKPFKPVVKKGAKYVLPAAGLVLSNMNRSAISAEYEENPTKINLARKKISEAQVGLETADTATLGATGLVTWIPNLMGDAADYILRQVQTPQTKEESDKEIEDQLGDKFYTF